MSFFIKEVSKATNLSAHTIRYYEQVGLLPNISRNSSGVRIFSKNDLFWIEIIKCLKETGMKIETIKHIVHLSIEGDHTKLERKNILLQHRDSVLKQIEALNKNLNKIDLKIKYYENI